MQTSLATLETIDDAVESIITQAYIDVQGTRDANYHVYELHKKRLERLFLPADKYEQACRDLATALNV